MTTRAQSFEGACGTADTNATLGSAYTFPTFATRIVAIIVGYGDEGVQEPHDSTVTLTLNDEKGPFEFVATSGGATASAASFALGPATIIPVDIPVQGGSTNVTVEAKSSGTPESVRVSLVYE